MHNSAERAAKNSSTYTTGSEGIWTFVFIDMVIFLLIFFTFMSERMRHLGVYIASQLHLNELFGLANTLILLSSSWMVVEAIKAVRAQAPRKVVFYLWLALLLGLAFSINKLIEYQAKFASGITPVTNPFYSFYFFITLVHFLHVLAGMIFIWHYAKSAKTAMASNNARHLTGLENVGLFWHYVDVLWIFIFPLLYLVGRQ